MKFITSIIFACSTYKEEKKSEEFTPVHTEIDFTQAEKNRIQLHAQAQALQLDDYLRNLFRRRDQYGGKKKSKGKKRQRKDDDDNNSDIDVSKKEKKKKKKTK